MRKCLISILALFLAAKLFAQDTQSVYIGDVVEADTFARVPQINEMHESRSSRIVLRSVPDSVVENYKSQKEFSYANDPDFWKKDPPAKPNAFAKFIVWFLQSPLMRIIIYLVAGIVMIIIIYQIIAVNNFFVFKKRGKKAGQALNEENWSPDNYDAMLADAIGEKDYRLATRILYLKTLQFLNDRRMIQLNSKFTNHDYVEQMRKNSEGAAFARLTSFYEYAWYGEYPLNEQQFEFVHNNFNRFISNA